MTVRFHLLFIFLLSTICTSGCSTQMSAKVINADLYQASNYYVVISNPKSNMKGVDGEIVQALAEYGISARILEAKEAEESDATVMVSYQDWYKWDIVQYLWTLDIYFNDTEMKPFAHSNFHHGGLHTFPDRVEVVRTLIDKMMLELGVPKK